MAVLNDDVLKSMKIGKVFKSKDFSVSQPPCRINGMDFCADGKLLVTSSDDGTVVLYGIEGSIKSKRFCKKSGFSNVRFTHHPSAVIGSSSLSCFDYSVRCLSIHDNHFVREFRGHTDRVVSLAMSPLDDTFLSGSMDGSVRFWDLNFPKCFAVLKRAGHHVVAYDPSGVAFCVGSQNSVIKLYDIRELKGGPFSTFQIAHGTPYVITDIVFSDNGKFLVVTTTTNLAFLVDAFTGVIHRKFTSFCNENACRLGVSFSPDSKYISLGSEDGKIHTWETTSTLGSSAIDGGKGNESDEVSIWEGHAGPVGCVAWNRKYQMVASACSNTAFWASGPLPPPIDTDNDSSKIDTENIT